MLKLGKKKEDSLDAEPVPLELPMLAKDLLKNRKKDPEPPEPRFVERRMEEKPIFQESKPLLQEPKQMPLSSSVTQAEQIPINKNTFFSDLLEEVKRESADIDKAEKLYKEKLLSQDLLSGMKNYWEQKKGDIIFTTEEKKLKEKMLKEIKDLQGLESQWQNLHLSLIEAEEKIRSREAGLKTMLKEFKELCSRHVNSEKKAIPQEHYFKLADGNIVKDLKELTFALKMADEQLFRHHVNVERNDFARWIADVFQDYALAGKLKSAFSKEDTVAILDSSLNQQKD